VTAGRKTKPTKPDETRKAVRLVLREKAYKSAVRRAVEAIREVEGIGPESVSDLLDQLSKGETLFPGDLERIRAAIAPTKRKPGRPIGSGALRERRIVAYAIYRTLQSRLPTYRNPLSTHRFTKVDAIAEAMKQCGLRRVCTYEAIAAEMRRQKPEIQRSIDSARASASKVILQLEAIEAYARKLISANPALAKLLEFAAVAAVEHFAKKLDENY
jgi:hypothetical protein